MNNEFRPELAEAIKLIQAGEFESAIQALTPFEESQDLELKVQALNFIGTCYFHGNNNKQAELYYEKVCAVSHACRHWFNLAFTSATNKNISKALAAFEQALVYAKEQNFPSIPSYRYYFARALIEGEAYEHALTQLNYLWESHMYYHITDSTFLDMRGMLFFDTFLRGVVLVLNGLGDKFDGRSWLAILSKHVDEHGQEQIKNIIPELTTPQYGIDSHHIFKIPLPLALEARPLKAIIEGVDLDPTTGNKYIMCRVYEGILKPPEHILLQKNNGQVLNVYIEKLSLHQKEINELTPGQIAIIDFSGISPDDVEEGDLIEYAHGF